MNNLGPALLEALPPMNPQIGTKNLSSNDPMAYAYCCTRCRKEIRQLEIKLLGKTIRPVPVCKCVSEDAERRRQERELANKRDYIRRVYGEGLIDDDLKRSSFDNFIPREGSEKAYQMAKDFALNFKQQSAGMYLFGPVGVGKSHLTAAIHNHLSRQGIASVYIDAPQLFGLAKSTFNNSSKKTDQDYVQAAIRCELLTLDEIGLTPLSQYEFDLLFQIINGRKGRLTNFTSNLGLEELEQWFKYDRNGKPLDPHGRLFDRLLGQAQPIRLKGESYRRYLAKKRLAGGE
ncbi:ATP-binding protein [Kroppenstedtia eburnea]|uniref:ATP-binding protein n=1 Tax=Kroppenstedtia eburnea TaxID=714067 RepID=UPI00363E910D